MAVVVVVVSVAVALAMAVPLSRQKYYFFEFFLAFFRFVFFRQHVLTRRGGGAVCSFWGGQVRFATRLEATAFTVTAAVFHTRKQGNTVNHSHRYQR